jgi:hypothetical protein
VTKTLRKAFLHSATGVIAFTLVSAILNLLIPYLLTGDIHAVVGSPERLSQPGDLLALAVILLAALAALIAIGAYWLYRFFGERYFDRLAPLRWALFGALFALLIQIPNWILPDGWWLLTNLLQLAAVFLAFFAARTIVPLDRRKI